MRFKLKTGSMLAPERRFGNHSSEPMRPCGAASSLNPATANARAARNLAASPGSPVEILLKQF
jgi:hypothetical protein